MNVMDKVFELYSAYFDRLAADIRRLNRERPHLNSGPMLARRQTREEFEQYLLNGRETETKRYFLRRILRGNEHLYALLPDRLRSLAERAA